MERATQEQLLAKCREWQAILKLQDWDIKLRLARYYDEPNLGSCSWTLPKKMATIRIQEYNDYDPANKWERDQEITLVHELLHLHFAPFDADDGNHLGLAQEQAIHAISVALVNLARAAVPQTLPEMDKEGNHRDA